MIKFLGNTTITTILTIYKTFALYYLWNHLGVAIVGLPKLGVMQIYVLAFIYASFNSKTSASDIKALENDYDDFILKARLLNFVKSTVIFAVTYALGKIVL